MLFISTLKQLSTLFPITSLYANCGSWVSQATCGYGLNRTSSRVQTVSIKNYLSQYLPVNFSVSHGSILGPLLFLISINDLASNVQTSKILFYADDT